MKRVLAVIAAIIVSNFAAYVLLILASPVMLVFHDVTKVRWDSALFMALIMAHFGIFHILIAFTPLSVVMALIGLVFQRHARKDCMIGGILTGLGLFLLTTALFGLGDSYIFAPGPLIGAVCGWVYWYISIHRHSPLETTPI